MAIKHKLVVSVLLALFAGEALAADSAAPRFEITSYVVEGNALLKPDEIEQRVAPSGGKIRILPTSNAPWKHCRRLTRYKAIPPFRFYCPSRSWSKA